MRASAIIAVWTILSGPVLRAEPGVYWGFSYGAAVAESKAIKQPLLIVACTDRCQHCERLLTSFRDPALLKLVDDGFIRLKLHTSRDTDLLKQLRIESFPTVILAAPGGKILSRFEGYRDTAALTVELQRALSACVNGCGCDCKGVCKCGTNGPCKPGCQCVQKK